MASSAKFMVIVWEWMNEYGNWRPYDPHVSDFLENKYQTSSIGPVSLVQADNSLAMYSADFTTMCQIRFGTGTARPIRRQLYPDSSPPGKGVVWQWEGDQQGQWHNYDLQVSIVIEDYFSQNSGALGLLDLSKTGVKLPYVLDLGKMTQRRIETGRLRNLRREVLNSPYTVHNQSTVNSSAVSNSAYSAGSVGKRAHGQLTMPVASGAKKARYCVLGGSSQMSNSSSGQQSSATGGQGHSISSSGSLNSQTQNTNVPLTRNKLNMMIGSQGSQSQQNGLTMMSSQNLGQGQMPNSHLAQQSTSGQSAPSMLNMQSSCYIPPAPLAYLHNLHRTSHSLLHPGAVQYLGQFGPPGSVQYMQPNNSTAVNIHGSNSSNPGIAVPSSLLGRNKSASRISPVVTSATNLLMSPAVPQFLSPSSSSGGITQFNLPVEDRIPNNAPKAKKNPSGKSASCDIFSDYATIIDKPSSEEDCCICCERLNHPSGYGEGKQEATIVLQLDKCKHMFHKLCLQAMYDSGTKNGCLQCPTCKTIYGEKHGNCPHGMMEYHPLAQPLPGYEGCRTIQIMYHISPGIQGPEHPHPGRRYTCRGFPRVCYLPDNEKGRKVLKLLTVAWKRRLTFTIGMSTTTGESDTVTWNEIHHKTEFGTNHSGHGFPDDKYLDNVLMELAVHGVTETDL